MKTSSYMLKLGAPGLLLGLLAIGCTPGARVASLSSFAPKPDKQAARRAADADAAIKARKSDVAVAAAEQAVSLAPRDAGYRTILGQAYLLAGRFTSAEASFGEALALDPTPGKTSFNLALTQIALGKWEVARGTLAKLDGVMPDSDIGLAVALAGDREGGIVILERAARAEGAGVKARQNLALAYALAGRWNDAQTVAAQDMAQTELLQRISDWSKFARPQSAWDQVASLLGVTPVEDPGRPAALALADPAPAAAFAVVAPAPAAAPVATAPVEIARVDPTPVVHKVAVPAAQPVEPPVAVAEAAPTAPMAVAVPVNAFVAPRPAAAPAPLLLARREPMRVAPRQPVAPRAGGKWVVQLGAFSQPRAVEAAWSRLSGRVSAVRAYAPAKSTFVVNAATVHRLTLSGFATRNDAQRMCVRVKARGGDCFVRAAAGEQPIRWAARQVPTLLAMR